MSRPAGSPPQLIRSADAADAPACAAVYAPYVTDTVITFEAVPPEAAEMAARIAAAVREHAWLVLEEDGRVVGYAYGSPYKSRAAYRWACEVSATWRWGGAAAARGAGSTKPCSPNSSGGVTRPRSPA